MSLLENDAEILRDLAADGSMMDYEQRAIRAALDAVAAQQAVIDRYEKALETIKRTTNHGGAAAIARIALDNAAAAASTGDRPRTA